MIESYFDFSFSSFILGGIVILILEHFIQTYKIKCYRKNQEKIMNEMFFRQKQIQWEFCFFMLTEYAELIEIYNKELSTECFKFRNHYSNKLNNSNFADDVLQEMITVFHEKHEQWIKTINEGEDFSQEGYNKFVKTLNTYHHLIVTGANAKIAVFC